MNPVVHFEMPADDRNRMADFYTRVFGWKAEFFGEEMGNYVTVATTETDENGRPKAAGTINGGFYPREKGAGDQHPSLVIAVDDIHTAMDRIKASGGRIISGPVNIPQVGQYAAFYDTEGNRASILQPDMQR